MQYLPMYCICRVFFMSDSRSSLWGKSVHVAKFAMFRFSQALTVFIQFQSNIMINMLVMGEYSLCLDAIWQKLILWRDRDSA